MNDKQNNYTNDDNNLSDNIYTERLKHERSYIYRGSARKIGSLNNDSRIDYYGNNGEDKANDYKSSYGNEQNTAQGYREPKQSAKSLIRKRKKNRSKEILGWVLSIGIAVCAAFLIRAFVFEIILVDGDSMLPTLYTDERVAIEKLTRYGGMPERGDIIIVKYPNMDGNYVKRVIGLPGETVEVKDSIVYINGQPIEEEYINTEPYADMEEITVPENHVFVMGDNRAHSLDSRAQYIGPIPHESIIGHALFVIWPLSNIHSIQS